MSALKSGRPRRKLLGQMSRAAFEGATSFGTAVTGVNNKELNTLRSLAGNLQDHKQAGKSLTLSLMLAPTKDLDPSIGATWLPVK
eukprot:4457346-Pyramimonas_sp.AAC.1